MTNQSLFLGCSGSKLEQAKLDERRRIEEQTAKRITRGKK
jgi:hypothetical protein